MLPCCDTSTLPAHIPLGFWAKTPLAFLTTLCLIFPRWLSASVNSSLYMEVTTPPRTEQRFGKQSDSRSAKGANASLLVK